MISPLPEALVETEILLHGIQFHECSLPLSRYVAFESKSSRLVVRT